MAHLAQYHDALTPAGIAEGMNRAVGNARRLATDASTLLAMSRIPSAVALAILSIEESGKVALLRQMALADNAKEVKAVWKAYRSHTKKNVMWILGDLIAKGGRTLEDLRKIVDPESNHPDELDNLKQLSIYTDCLKGNKWSSPEDVDLAALAPYLVKMAEVLAQFRNFVPEEVQLWREHLLPVKHSSLEKQTQAVQAWYHEMNLRGLSDVSTDGMNVFLGAGPKRHQA